MVTLAQQKALVQNAQRRLPAKLGRAFRVVDVIRVGRYGVAERSALVLEANQKKYFFKSFLLNSAKFLDTFRKTVKYHTMFARPEVKLLRSWTSNGHGYMLSKFVQTTKFTKLSKHAMHKAVLMVANDLARMHDAKCVHNDLAPKNILVKPSGKAYLIDFEDTKLASPQEIKQENNQFLALFWQKKFTKQLSALQSICIQVFQNEPTCVKRVESTVPAHETYLVSGRKHVHVVLARQSRGKHAGKIRVVSVHPADPRALDQVLRGVSFGRSAYFKTNDTLPFAGQPRFTLNQNVVEWADVNHMRHKKQQ
jgi:serine/threonine protein kinase